MAEFLILGSVGFWVLVAIASLLIIACVENDAPGFGLIATGVAIGVGCLFGNLERWLLTWWLPVYLAAYMAAGLAWCFPKWFRLLRRLRREYDAALADYKQCNKLPINQPLPADHWKRWSNQLVHWNRYGLDFDGQTGVLTPPTFRANRDRLLTWATFWPWSMLWTLVRDWVMRGVELAVDAWQGVFEWMSRRVFGD